MTRPPQNLKQIRQKLAPELLRSKKLTVLSQNLATKFGPIDILAQDGQTLVIIELKTKSSRPFSSVMTMMTRAKQEQLILLALELQKKYQTAKVRIDIISVDQAQAEPILKHHKGVIEFNG